MAKLTKAQWALHEALAFLEAHSLSLRAVAPPGRGEEYAAAHWWPREPSYAWNAAYGAFSPATLKAGCERGLIERKQPYHAYRITPAGRQALSSKEGR